MQDRADPTRYGVGDAVRVRVEYPVTHHRSPNYIKGKSGRIEAVLRAYRNPETRAYGGDGIPRQPLYRVEFDQAHLWQDYRGSPNDTLLVDVYQNWLEPG